MENFIENTQRCIASYVWPFYKIYRYDGKIKITRADARGAISEHDRFFYNRIPKVANSTIVKTLAYCSATLRAIHPDVDGKNFFLRPASVGIRTALDIKEKYFKFTFVRNPFTRVLSAYLDKIVRAGGRRHYRRYAQWAAKKGASKTPSFADFCSYLDDGGLYEDAHWAPQFDCLLIPVSEFDFVGRFERLDTDLHTVLKRIFPVQVVSIQSSGPSKTHASDKLHQHYSDREVEIVGRLYADDFRTFGYKNDLEDLRISLVSEPFQAGIGHSQDRQPTVRLRAAPSARTAQLTQGCLPVKKAT